jgi:hypothetical protein
MSAIPAAFVPEATGIASSMLGADERSPLFPNPIAQLYSKCTMHPTLPHAPSPASLIRTTKFHRTVLFIQFEAAISCLCTLIPISHYFSAKRETHLNFCSINRLP